MTQSTKRPKLTPLQHRIEEAAELLAVSRRTIERLIACGELETVGQGRLRRVTHASIIAYQNRHRNEKVA